jgi:hypothetical protein
VGAGFDAFGGNDRPHRFEDPLFDPGLAGATGTPGWFWHRDGFYALVGASRPNGWFRNLRTVAGMTRIVD